MQNKNSSVTVKGSKSKVQKPKALEIPFSNWILNNEAKITKGTLRIAPSMVPLLNKAGKVNNLDPADIALRICHYKEPHGMKRVLQSWCRPVEERKAEYEALKNYKSDWYKMLESVEESGGKKVVGLSHRHAGHDWQVVFIRNKELFFLTPGAEKPITLKRGLAYLKEFTSQDSYDGGDGTEGFGEFLDLIASKLEGGVK